MDKLTLEFKNSIFNQIDPSIHDVIIDGLELGIDSILENDILKQLPLVSFLIGTIKTCQNIYERNLLKQTLSFINTLNKDTIAPKKLEKYKRKLEDSKYVEKELGRVLILLNSNIDIQKSKILAKIFIAYVNEDINWDKFCELSDLNSRIYISDINLFNNIAELETTKSSLYENYQIERLISLGLIDSANEGFRLSSTTSKPMEKIIGPSSLGKIYYIFTK